MLVAPNLDVSAASMSMARENGDRLAYEPLDADFYEFRILRILPDSDSSTIYCLLKKTSLIEQSRKATYTALSYCWGDPIVTEKIYVNSVLVAITENLCSALWWLRHLEIYETWADALCINQEHKQERSM